jgi:L-ribulose-5-phosphate 3-epimerase UlaE
MAWNRKVEPALVRRYPSLGALGGWQRTCCRTVRSTGRFPLRFTFPASPFLDCLFSHLIFNQGDVEVLELFEARKTLTMRSRELTYIEPESRVETTSRSEKSFKQNLD